MRVRDLHLIILKNSVMTLLNKKRLIKETYLSHAYIYFQLMIMIK
jgi:hypothetical protein